MSKDDSSAWTRFLQEGFTQAPNPDSIGTFLVSRFPFDKMTKKFGKAYVDYLSIAFAAWTTECGSEIDFLDYHTIPVPFFEKTVKPASKKYEVNNGH